MSIRKSISVLSIVLLIVGLMVGAGGGYLYSSSTLQPKIKNYESMIGSFETQVNELTSDVSDLTMILADLQSDKSNLESQVSAFITQVSTLETENSELEAQLLSLETDISELEGQVNTLMNQNSDLEEMIFDQQIMLGEAQVLIDELEDELSDQESEKEYLREVLEYYLPETFRIGVTTFSSEDFLEVQAIANISQANINEFCEENDYPYRFEITVYRNYEDPYEAVETTIRLEKKGTNLIVGHETDSECELSLNYVNTHDMLMISPSATSRSLSISNDAFYRTCPTDLRQAPVIAEMLHSWGIEAVVIILSDDSWGNGLFEAFEAEFGERGGIIHQVIRYDPAATTYIPKLNSAESAVKEALTLYQKERTALLLFAQDKVSKFVEPVPTYFPNLNDVIWFGTSSTVDTKQFVNVASQADHLKIFGPIVAQEENEKYLQFAEDYLALTGESPNFYRSALYDACWLYALSVIEALTIESSFVELVLPTVAEDYQGASGWCKFDEYGDRERVDYEIRGFVLLEETLTAELYGYYESINGIVTWFTEKGINPPE